MQHRQYACARSIPPTQGEARRPGRKWWRQGKGWCRTRRSRAGAGRGRESQGDGSEGASRDGAPRGRRRGVQSTGEPAFTAANPPSPRAPCLATEAFLHHVRVRWAVAGYKRLRPSGRPPFWGSFRGKFGCSVACWETTFCRERLAREAGRGRIYRAATVFPTLLRSGPQQVAFGNVLRRPVLITPFSFCVPFIPG